MAFLTIGGLTVEITEDGAEEGEPIREGERVRAFDNSLLSTESTTVKRAWTFTTRPLTFVEHEALRAIVDAGGLVACGGDALGGAVACGVRVTRSTFRRTKGGGFTRVVTLALEEA